MAYGLELRNSTLDITNASLVAKLPQPKNESEK